MHIRAILGALSIAAGSHGIGKGVPTQEGKKSQKAKVNNSSLVGLGYTQTLKPGIKLTLSALLDGKNINAGGHKLGLGLEFQA